MLIRFTYHLTGGLVVTQDATDFASVEEAAATAMRMCDPSYSAVSLNGTNGDVRVINSNHIVSITVEKAEG